MEPRRHLEILAVEGARLATVPVDALGAPIPSIPGWTVEEVVRHVGKVHQWAAGVIRLPADGDAGTVRPAGMPKGPDCLPAYREALDLITAALTERPPDTEVQSFIGSVPLAWWIRRQAHEVSVHRWDAQSGVAAAGGADPDAFDVDTAADGIDEWASTFLAVRWAQRTDPEPPADGSEWLISFVDGGVRVEATHAKGDVALRGPAAELLLAMWRRQPLDTLEVIGDRAVAEKLLEVATF